MERRFYTVKNRITNNLESHFCGSIVKGKLLKKD